MRKLLAASLVITITLVMVSAVLATYLREGTEQMLVTLWSAFDVLLVGLVLIGSMIVAVIKWLIRRLNEEK